MAKMEMERIWTKIIQKTSNAQKAEKKSTQQQKETELEITNNEEEKTAMADMTNATDVEGK